MKYTGMTDETDSREEISEMGDISNMSRSIMNNVKIKDEGE